MDLLAGLAARAKGSDVVPRPVVIGLVCVLTGLLCLDVGAQFVPGSTHEANQVLDAALLTIIGGVVTASRGPKPEDAAAEPPAEPAPPAEPSAARGRHRG